MSKIYIVIPAHNEEKFISKTLDSLVNQSLLPHKIVVVDDNSSDNTNKILKTYVDRYPFITIVHIRSKEQHLPGSKVINAFNAGLKVLDMDYDILCKFDADLIFPSDYLETIASHFNADHNIGMAGGFCYISKNKQWELENLTNKDHIRGALKAYRKECFKDINGLMPAMGWDTIDELLTQFYGWSIKTDASLKVKHLKPTGQTYHTSSKLKQGQAFYQIRYGFWLTLIASIKLSVLKKQPKLFFDYLQGYFKAVKNRTPYLVTAEQGRFIRKLRWKKIFGKLF
ncbi:glycosyltransferase [Aquimarina intermedia]|uniref:Glycosyl transferase family 2 n=1 Tax=Aquimarina intermedia TaxID=350814 RepID=A0A5S5C535_9FLAO|nr:glycosyltransferase family 2 protein [Aquimarina intermedia]TYP73440.1 glycosyl transferase family 2 [Aquimarina intermedia]